MSTFASRQCRQSSVSRLVVLVRPPLCCSVLQCGVAVYCSVFQSTIASVTTLVNRPCRSLLAWQPVILVRPHFRCTVLQCVHTRGCSRFCSVPRRVAVCCNAQCRLSTFASRPCRPLSRHSRWFWCVSLSVAVCCSVVLQGVAGCCSVVLQCSVMICNVR